MTAEAIIGDEPMFNFSSIQALSRITEAILCPPFEWRHVKGGTVTLESAVDHGGTPGGIYHVPDFAIANYPITNAQYVKFLDDPNGYSNSHWWQYSSEAAQWHRDHPRPKPTAFDGPDLPRTCVSWFDSMAFCHWLPAELKNEEGAQHKNLPDAHNPATWTVRLPTEQEWQRAAVGDSGWRYPWGDQLDETRGNYGQQVGYPTRVGSYPDGKSPYEVMDMVGNVWEWCLTTWGVDGIETSGYTYRLIRGGAWNVSNPEYLRATDRGGNSPRGRLNDCGFRCVYCYQC